MTFRATLDRAPDSLDVYVKASCQPYHQAVGVPWLGSEPEIEILSVADESGKEIPTEDFENVYLKNLALDYSKLR